MTNLSIFASAMACCMWRVDPTKYHHPIPVRGGHHLRVVLSNDLPVTFSFKIRTGDQNEKYRKVLISSVSFKKEGPPSGYKLGSWSRYAYEENNVRYLVTKIEMNDGRVEWCDFAKNTVTKIFPV